MLLVTSLSGMLVLATDALVSVMLDNRSPDSIRAGVTITISLFTPTPFPRLFYYKPTSNIGILLARRQVHASSDTASIENSFDIVFILPGKFLNFPSTMFCALRSIK